MAWAKLEGPTAGGKPGIDFTDWNWGDMRLDNGSLKEIADRVAEVIFDELITTINEHHSPPYLNIDDEPDCSGEVAISIAVMEDHFLTIPLSGVQVDSDMMFALYRDPKNKANKRFDTDWPTTIARKQEAIKTLQGWIRQIEEMIRLDRKAMDEGET